MRFRLIADAGSTKTDWALTDERGVETTRFTTDGLNALLAEENDISLIIDAVQSKLPADSEIVAIHYYGAGCATPEICMKIERPLREGFRADVVEVNSDLLGAARGLLQHSSGIACILGTGSNSCLYDGEKIVHNVPSLGYILGDEGSGAALGKRLVADSFKGHLPQVISDRFLETYGLSLSSILDKVYRSSAPNRFLASLVPFLQQNLWNPYVYSLVRREFENFLQRCVSPYNGARTLPISFTGSVAYHFADILREAGRNLGFNIGSISTGPLDGLVRYHSDPVQ